MQSNTFGSLNHAAGNKLCSSFSTPASSRAYPNAADAIVINVGKSKLVISQSDELVYGTRQPACDGYEEIGTSFRRSDDECFQYVVDEHKFDRSNRGNVANYNGADSTANVENRVCVADENRRTTNHTSITDKKH
jgi:hypothetical protein